MTQSHYEVVLRMAPEAAGRVALLDPSGESVADPIGRDLDAYRACANHLESAVASRLMETA
jgi:protein-tyrosine-phosphatase